MRNKKLNVLVIGSGGREHALVWKIIMSLLVGKVYATGVNAGMEKIAEMVALDVTNFEAVAQFCRRFNIGLVVVGPEKPLANGLVDYLDDRNIIVFGPNQKAAQLEADKIEAKLFMLRHGIPTAPYRVFTDPPTAMEHIKGRPGKFVVKAPYLCEGKGVYPCQNAEEGMRAVREIMIDRKFGPDNASRIIIENFLDGQEVSFLALVDGEYYLPLATSQDHKRALDGDQGDNTGGMGAYSPAMVVTAALDEKIQRKIMRPLMAGLKRDRITYKGVIYVGLMIVNGEPFVLEFNARFGDPETQPILSRMKSDLVPLMLACVDGTLGQHRIEWDSRPAVCVVMASAGYPGTPVKGKIITGLEEAGALPDTTVFQAGTKSDNGQVVTNGGRVLGVNSLGATIPEAIKKAYAAVSLISFEGTERFRHDIAAKAQ